MRRNFRRGFTLIELLIVVVIIGILAAIAIPKFASTKEKAYLASEKSDLRNMATSEEAYFSGNQTYTTNQSAMNFTTSQGVTITGMVADAKGWKGTSQHSATTKKCYAGFGSQAAATTLDGIITAIRDLSAASAATVRHDQTPRTHRVRGVFASARPKQSLTMEPRVLHFMPRSA